MDKKEEEKEKEKNNNKRRRKIRPPATRLIWRQYIRCAPSGKRLHIMKTVSFLKKQKAKQSKEGKANPRPDTKTTTHAAAITPRHLYYRQMRCTPCREARWVDKSGNIKRVG